MFRYQKLLTEYLDCADSLLKNDDEVSLTYCALELRKAIELIIWKQFSDAFAEPLSRSGLYRINFSLKLQQQSITKMYDLLKKHIENYAEIAEGQEVVTFFTPLGDGPIESAPRIEEGKRCFIPPSLPTCDYRYLSEIIHYENEIDPGKNKPEKLKLKSIYDKIDFVKENYTFPLMVPHKDIDKIIENFKNIFHFTDEDLRSFNLKK